MNAVDPEPTAAQVQNARPQHNNKLSPHGVQHLHTYTDLQSTCVLL